MATQIAPLNHEEHASLKLREGVSAAHVENDNIIPVVISELGMVAMECPIVFVKNSATGQFLPVAMLGVKPGENLFVKEGRWTGVSRPGVVALHPFKLVPNPENAEQMFAGIDLNCELVSETEGAPLFSDGKATDLLENRKKAMTQHFEFSRVTEAFTQKLVELDLLVARDLNLTVGEEQYSLDGMYLVDEQKLRELDDAVIVDLHKRGFLQAIYIMMTSINQVRRLIELKLGNI